MSTIVVNAPPVAKGRPRFGRGRVFTPRTTEVAEQRIREAWTGGCFQGPVRLTVEVSLPRPAGHFGKRGLRPSAPEWPSVRPDLDNYLKTVLDALQKGVAFRDDSQVINVLAFKRYVVNGEVPGWRISVYAL